MKKVILTKISGLFLLGILSVSCSSEESVTSNDQLAKTENSEAFRMAYREYAISMKNVSGQKNATADAGTKMAEESLKYLNSLGINTKSFEEKNKVNEDMIISLAFAEFAKTKTTKRN